MVIECHQPLLAGAEKEKFQKSTHNDADVVQIKNTTCGECLWQLTGERRLQVPEGRPSRHEKRGMESVPDTSAGVRRRRAGR